MKRFIFNFLKVFFLSGSFLFSFTSFSQNLEIPLPANAYEAELSADQLEKQFIESAVAHNISNPKENATLLFLYAGERVPQNIRWLASVLTKRGVWVKFERDRSNEEALDLV